MNKVKIITLLLGTCLFLLNSVYAQTLFHFGYTTEYNSNPFYSPTDTSMFVNSFEAGAGFGFSNSIVYYTANYYMFEKRPEHNFFFHNISLSGGDSVLWEFSVNQRINKPEDNYVDYIQINAGGEIILPVTAVQTVLAARFHIMKYPNFQEMNYNQMDFSSRFSKFFKTRTTIIVSAHYSNKSYTNSIEVPTTDSINSSAASFFSKDNSTFSALDASGNGGGKYGGGSGGMNSTMFFEQNPDPVRIGALDLSVRLAQGLGNQMGLAVFYRKHLIMSGINRFVSGDVINYQMESIFDDPLSYESDLLGGQLTYILPGKIVTRAIFSTERKDYAAQTVYVNADSIDSSILRRDTRHNIIFSMEKVFRSVFGDYHNLNLGIYMNLLQNKSNSYWYDYKNNSVALNFKYEF